MLPLELFIEKWCHPEYPPNATSAAELTEAENAFGVLFPNDYRTQILRFGLPSPTGALLSSIIDAEVNLNDLSELLSGQEIVDGTDAWRKVGMPQNLIIIGEDSMGNKFCFDQLQISDNRREHSPIYFWDHDFDETEELAASFSRWIQQYLGDWAKGFSFEDF